MLFVQTFSIDRHHLVESLLKILSLFCFDPYQEYPDEQSVLLFSPHSNMEKIFPAVGYCSSLNKAVKDTDAVVILTEWHEFRGMDLEKVASLVREKVILDVKNILNPNELKRLGYNFDNVGRPTVK